MASTESATSIDSGHTAWVLVAMALVGAPLLSGCPFETLSNPGSGA